MTLIMLITFPIKLLNRLRNDAQIAAIFHRVIALSRRENCGNENYIVVVRDFHRFK